MIDFRYHLVSIIAVFVALAVGIVLGSGPLKEPIDNTLRQRYEQVENDKEALRTDLGEADARITYLDEASSVYVPALVGGQLADRTVVVVSLPGVDGGLVTDVREMLDRSGAEVTGVVGITDSYADPDRLDELEEVLDARTPADTSVPEGARPYVRAAAVLARGLVTSVTTTPATVDPAANALLSALQDEGFLGIDGNPASRASSAVVLAPDPAESPSDDDLAANRAYLEISLALSRLDVGTVVSALPGSAGDGGLVQAVRRNDEADGSISTVDTLDSVLGRVSTVLALVLQIRGETGHYGTGRDADLVAPPVPEPVVGTGDPDAESLPGR